MQVCLCPITKDNVQSVLSLRAAAELPGAPPGAAEALAVAAVTPGRLARAIVDVAEATVVGLLVHELDASSGRWWITDLLIDQRSRRRGYARSAIRQLIVELEPLQSIIHVYACYHPANAVAERFATALGFAPTGDGAANSVSVALALPRRLRTTPRVHLRDVTLENARTCISLTVAANQAGYVASNAASLVQSKFEPHWLTKAIYDGETMVGFAMYGQDPEFGWGVLRLMIDAAFQGRGYGRAAMRLVLAAILGAGGTSVGVSYEADNQVARRLYRSLGFVETGDQPFGEPFAVLNMAAGAAHGERGEIGGG